MVRIISYSLQFLFSIILIILTLTFAHLYVQNNDYFNNQKVKTIFTKIDILNRFLVTPKINNQVFMFRSRKEQITEVKYITIHHSASEMPVMVTNQSQRERGFKTLAYQFWINKDEIIQAHYINEISAGTKFKNINQTTIAICLQGNFNKTEPTKKQYFNLIKLLIALKKEYPTAEIKKHNDFDATDCPGNKFNLDKVIYNVNNFHFINLLLW